MSKGKHCSEGPADAAVEQASNGASEGEGHDPQGSRASLWAAHIFQIIVVASGLFVSLQLGRLDLAVPINFGGDTVLPISSITAIVQSGWYWWNPLLSAPYSFPVISFPANASVDYAVAWLVARFSSEPGLICNVTWLAFFFLSAITAAYCLRALRIRVWISALVGTLYGFLPFAFFRNTAHMQLTFYLIPFVCALSIQIAAGERPGKRRLTVLLAGSTLLGFNYPYYACFGVLLLGAALLVAAMRGHARKMARVCVLALGLIACATLLNLLPSIVYWQMHGKPFDDYKAISEVETFGLKVSRFVLPVPGHTFWPLAKVLTAERNAGFPLDNENTSVRLGLVFSAGFVFLLGCLLGPRWLKQDRHGYIASASRLSIILILVCSIGGLATVFSLLLQSAQIRAYNRASVFVAFFCAVAVAWGAELWMRRTRRPGWLWLLFLGLCGLGMYDQSRAALFLAGRYESDRLTAAGLSDMVHKIETRICSSCMVYQMPATLFPLDDPHYGMQAYDHGRVQVFSRTLHWSWPPASVQAQAWEQPLRRMAASEVVDYLIASGFSAIWLDREGYPGGGKLMNVALSAIAGPPVVESKDGRYAAFDLRPLRAAKPAGGSGKGELILNPLVSTYGSGFYPLEFSAAEKHPFHWSKAKSVLTIRNPASVRRPAVFRAFLQSGSQAEVLIDDGHNPRKLKVTPEGTKLELELDLAPGESREIRFSFTGEPLRVTGEPRELCFTVGTPTITDM